MGNLIREVRTTFAFLATCYFQFRANCIFDQFDLLLRKGQQIRNKNAEFQTAITDCFSHLDPHIPLKNPSPDDAITAPVPCHE